MQLSLIVAMANNRCIGLNNQLPWHLPADLKRFKLITLGSTIVMGRKTYESIGRPLPGRTNIIISRNAGYRQPGCLVLDSLEEALAQGCLENKKLFVIGGSELYEAAMPLAQAIYMTQVHQSFQGDTFFPELNCSDWQEVSRETIHNDPAVPFSYSFVEYRPKKHEN